MPPPYTTGKIKKGSPSFSNREDTALRSEDTAGFSLLLQQGRYRSAIPPAPPRRITQGSPSYSKREDATGLSLLV
jgi:hypothetical protein